MDQDVLRLVQAMYGTEVAARAVLLKIGYPVSSIPRFDAPHTFWPAVLHDLDDRVTYGTIKLLQVTADENPGSQTARRLLARLVTRVETALMESVTESALEPSTGLGRDPRARTGTDRGGESPPGAPPVSEESGAPGGDTSTPTLTLYSKADLLAEFRDVARELFGEVTDLYSILGESALCVPDQGDRHEAMRRTAQLRMRQLDRNCRVAYRKFSFKPYLYRYLWLCGPDTARFETDPVPATWTPLDIAAAFLRQTQELVELGNRQAIVRAVIDLEEATESKRLDPHATLHESLVREGAMLRIGTQAIAGGLDPNLRKRAQLTAAAQIKHFSATHPQQITIVEFDDEELPGRITLEVSAMGLAPPPDLAARCELADADPAEIAQSTVPVIAAKHRVSIHFGPMFPLMAPQIVWDTPVFHPNVRWPGSAGFAKGMLLFFHPRLAEYRPDQKMGPILELITDITGYRHYDLVDGDNSANPVAAYWAESDAGQDLIMQIQGRDLDDPLRTGDSGLLQAPLLRLKSPGSQE